MSLICKLRNSIGLLFVFTLMINENIYGQLIYPDAVPLSDEQITVNGQTYTAKAWVKCYHGDQLKLKPDIPYDSNHCYDWLTGTIDNYQTPIMGCTVLGYEVKPCDESGIYLVTVRDKTTQSIIGTYCFVVYVVEGIKIKEANNVTECMDEYSYTQVDGVLIGKGMERVNTMKIMPITINYILEPTYGTLLMEEKHSIINGKFSGIKVQVPTMKGQFLTVKPSEYLFRIEATWNNFNGCYDRIDIRVYRLWIDYFKEISSPCNFNYVIGKNIEYQCSGAKVPMKSYQWSCKNWNLNNKGVVYTPMGSDLIVDPKTIDLLTDNSSYFDAERVTLIATDIYNNKYRVCSSFEYVDDPKNHMTKIKKGDFRPLVPEQRENAYYILDDICPLDGNGYPNWVYYWWDDVKKTKKQYVTTLGYNPAEKVLDAYTRHYTTKNDIEVYVCDNAVKTSKITGSISIDCLEEKLYHEYWHAEFFRLDQWPNGYNPADDIDMDEYSDSWEIKYGKNHGFTIGTKGVKDLNDFYDLNKPNSIGTIFEETQCQLIELMTKHTLTHLDYSFQGKMWNNCN